MILRDVGEVGVHVGDRTHMLRPSLYHVSRIGSPADIVAAYGLVFDNTLDLVGAVTPDDLPLMLGWQAAFNVLRACWDGTDEEFTRVAGTLEPLGEFTPGVIPRTHVVPLARCLLKHGVAGDVPPPSSTGKTPEYAQEFVARDHVAFAVAHLGVSEREAWGMTMTSLLLALRAKFPPVPTEQDAAGGPLTVEHANEAAEWLEKLSAKRARRKGANRGGQ